MTAAASVPGVEIRAATVERGARPVIRDVSLVLERGELWALVGPNGSGKSTLIESIVGSLPLARGSIRLFGRPLESLSRRHVARQLALVGREVGRVPALKARAVVEMGRLPHGPAFRTRNRRDADAVERALRACGCSGLAERFMHTLSTGERQRVLFARALAQEPRIVLLDEATAHLDLVHREEMLDRLSMFTERGGIVLTVLHDLDLAVRRCSRVAVLDRGRLRATGEPRARLDETILAEVFGVEARIVDDSKGPSLRIMGPARTGSKEGVDIS